MSDRLPLLSRRRVLATLAGSLAAAPLLVSGARADGRGIRVGILSGEDEDIWQLVQQNALARHLKIEVIPFSQGDPIDAALAAGDLDANAYQHGPYLKAQNIALSAHIVPAGNTYFAPIGLYSKKVRSVSAIPNNGSVGIPGDPTNEARALSLMQSLGLIKISSSAGEFPTVLDISENPKNLTIKELDDPVLSRSLADLDAAVVTTEWAYKGGVNFTTDVLARESMKDNPYINFIAVNERDLHAPWVQTLVDSFRQPNVRARLLQVYHGGIIPAWS